MKTKRFLSILLSLVLVLGMLPGMSLTASAAGNTMEITPTNTSGNMTITLKIKAAQTITASDVTATYGDTDKSVSASVTTPATGGGAISYAVKEGSGDYISVASDGKLTIKKVPPTDGKAYVIVTAAATDDYAETTKEVTVTISKAEVTVTALNQSIMAGGTVPDLSAPVLYTHYFVTGLVGEDTLTTAPTLAYQKNGSAATPDSATAGTYDIVPSNASAGDNYTVSYTNGTLTITAKDTQTITASDVTATYGDTDKSVSASTDGNGEISFAVKAGSENYIDVNASTGVLTIKAVPADGKAYVTVTAAETTTGGTGGNGYAAATKDVTVNISKATVTITAKDQSIYVVGTVPTLSGADFYTVTGLVGEETLTTNPTLAYQKNGSAVTPDNTTAGTYDIVPFGAAAGDNYAISYTNGTLTITARNTQTITASDVTATYGDTDKSVSATTDGNGEISYTVKAGSENYIDVNTSTGALTIKAVPADGKAYVTVKATETTTGGTGDKGYAAATKDVTVNISKATVTITAKDQSIYVGGTVPTLSGADFYTVTGLVGEETLTTAPTLAYQKNGEAATPDSATAGTYDIVPSGAAASDNYSISYTNGTLTISNKGTQTISAENVTATYGDTDKSVSATVTDPATGGGDISYAVKEGSGDYIDVDATTGALTIKKVPADGKAYVTVTAAETATYAQATKDVTVTISKANAVPATVTANTLTYTGSAQPLVTVTGTPTGGEMQYALGTATEATQPYTTSIPSKTNAGTYQVWYKVIGDANHNDSEAQCIEVSIGKKAVTVSAADVSVTYDGQRHSITVDVTDSEGAAITYKKAGEAEYGAANPAFTDAGEYKVAYQVEKENYTTYTGTAKVTIAKATQAAPAETFTAAKATGADKADGRISGFAVTKAYQYSADEGATWIDVTAESTSVEVKPGTYQIRYAGDKNHEAGATASVTVSAKADQNKPEGLKAENASAEDAADGQVTGVNSDMEYSTDGGTTWTAVLADKDKIEGLAAGEVLVRYAGTDDKNPGAAETVVIGVASKTEGVVDFKPVESVTPDAEEKAITGVDSETTKASVEEFAETQQEEGKDIKVALEITPQKEENVAQESVEETNKVVEEVFAGIDNEKVVTEYLAIDVAKYVDNVKDTENISDTRSPLEIALKFDTRKNNPVVVRNHDGRAKAFGKLKARPEKKDYKDAMFYVDTDQAILYIYSQFFSDFAIVYATETTYNVGFVTGTGKDLSQVVPEGGKITLPEGLTREGFAFDGWYQEDTYKNAWKDSDTVNADITLYGKWNKLVTGVSVEPASVKLTEAGETKQIEATVTPEDADNQKVTWVSGDEAVATVDENGLITAVANGTADITVTTDDGKKTAVVQVTVEIPEPATEEATTEEATTEEATTEEATTEEATTEEATTEEATTEEATTEEATTEETTTEEATTEEATTEEATTEEATTEEATTEAPTTEAPKTEKATTQAPKTEKATTQAPKTEKPTTEAPKETTEEETPELALNARLKISQTGSRITVKWGKVKEADGYQIYAAYCGKQFGKSVATVKGNSRTTITIKKLNGKKINLKKNFKVYVTAYKLKDGSETDIAKTITGHVVGRKNTKYSNAKKITLKKTKYTVAAGKTAAIKAKTVLVDPGKKQLSDAHASEFRYASSNERIATVDKKGKIKGVSAGTCTVYVFARNGYAKKIQVTVK